MKKQDFDIYELFASYYSGKLTDGETSFLLKWLKENPENKKQFVDSLKTVWRYQEIKVAENVQQDVIYDEIVGKIRTRKRFRIIKAASIAATLLLLVSISSLFLFTNTIDKEISVAELDSLIIPSRQNAVLTLASGESVNLDDESIKLLEEQNGARIEKDNNRTLKYNKSEDNESNELIYNVIEVPRGGEYNLILADGSRVWMNAESSLRFPVNFSSKNREVFLSGEAYFDVTSNKAKPFIVNAANSRVQVLGTQFNVNCYPEQAYISTTLVEGKVEVSNASQRQIIKPGSQAIVPKEEGNINVKVVNTSLYTSWVNGVLEFEDQDLEYIMIQLSRWYQVDFDFANEDLRHIRFTGAIKRDNTFHYTLNLIERLTDVKFKVKDSKILIED